MNLRSIVAVSALALGVVACGPQESSSGADGTWVGTITTEGNVTTVVNESGSVWGGTATLVEELSIGVDTGDDPYMFGRVTSVWATADEIYVVDRAIPAVRVYDREGVFLRDIGRRGQGPGEYQQPHRVAIDGDGTVFVSDVGGIAKVILYSPAGEYVDTWSWTLRSFPATQRLVMTSAGIPYLESIEFEGSIPTEAESRWGMQAVGPEGKSGELREFPRPDAPIRFQLTYLDGGMGTRVPFAPRFATAMLPRGELVYGEGPGYVFTIAAADGSTTIVECLAEPVAILAAEREALERFTTSRIRSRDPSWTWNGPPVPEHQPAYETFYPAQDGRLLVSRGGPGERVESPDCIDDPSPDDFLQAQRQDRTLSVCWRDPLIWDVFGSDGRYLGDLELPDLPVVADPFMDNETVLLAIEDEAGTIMVKRYRLVLPGER